jgi:hypothetical protein
MNHLSNMTCTAADCRECKEKQMSNNYTNIDWLKANHTMIHPFGLGFIQVKLNDTERMHFWHPAFHREREEVHNHRYDFHSTILVGSMYQELYSFWDMPGPYEMFNTDCAPAIEGAEPKALIEGTIRLDFAGIHNTGSEYTLNNTTFHRIEANKCVTFLRRGPKLKEFAQVIHEKNTPITCPFEEKMDADTMWVIVEECLRG